MNINNLLRKMAVALERKQNSLFSYDIEKQKKFINELGIPKDEIECSYFQYKCQMRFNKNVFTLLLNIAAFPMAMYYLFRYGKKSIGGKVEKKDAIFFRDGKPDNIMPISLQIEFSKIEKNPTEGILLTDQDKKFVKSLIRRYPLSWQFILKCIIKIGRYSFAIAKYEPSAIIVCAEYSFTSSVLTLYCQKRGVEHIDVMHGEKLYYMRDSFFKFDRCYIWDKYYTKLFTTLKADKTQFVIEVPKALKFCGTIEKTDEYDYTYYLGAESEEVLRKIANILLSLYNKGYRVSIRPHPRYSNIKKIEEIFSFVNIEDTENLLIEESLMRTGHAIALYSTVLNQALCNGIPIVIDNVSNPQYFKKLINLGYICLDKEHQVISDII